jgi:hypothetical protein
MQGTTEPFSTKPATSLSRLFIVSWRKRWSVAKQATLHATLAATRPMKMYRRITQYLLIAIALAVVQADAACESNAAAVVHPQAILWSNPTNIRSRNLFYGPGGRQGEPKGQFKFIKEDLDGTNPKFDVRDAAGSKWKVKLGVEAQPETAATRLLWAVGFVANENYFLFDLRVADMPTHLQRGQNLVRPNGHIPSVRLQKPPGNKKLGIWSWKNNPFTGTREFNALRVMMALLSNWDLKDVNNAVYSDQERPALELYEVSDVGSSFGRTGETYSRRSSKNNLPAYRKSKFIAKITPEYVNFNFPTHLPYLYIFNFHLFFSQKRLHWVGQHIPRSDARWIGSLLGELSPEQIRDAFRAAGYSPDQVEGYATTVQARIAELQRL